MNTTQIADARFQNGYSCSQSVFSALAEQWNIGPEVSLRIAAGFGGGIARTAGTCGCVTGGIMALGLTQREISPEGKEKTYEVCRQFMRAFEDRNGSLLCSGLLGCDISTPEGRAKAHQDGLTHARCTKFVRDAVEIVESLLHKAPGSDVR
jgi:C_GCAxxG_C_C family probable redox protein